MGIANPPPLVGSVRITNDTSYNTWQELQTNSWSWSGQITNTGMSGFVEKHGFE
jgi:hypothetical protein